MQTYQPNTTIAEMIARAGHNQAAAKARSGQIWGGAIANVGDIAAGGIEQWQRGKAADAAAQAKAKAEEMKQGEEILKAVGERLALVPEDQWQSEWEAASEAVEATGKTPLPAFNRSVVSGLARLYGKPPEPVKLERVKTRDAAGNETEQFVVPKPGDSFKSAAPPKEEKPDARSIDVLIAHETDPQKLADLLKRKRLSEEAGRAPRVPEQDRVVTIDGRPMLLNKNGVAREVQVPPGSAAPVAPAEAPFVAQEAYKKLPAVAKNQVSKAAGLILMATSYRDRLLELTKEKPSGTLWFGEEAGELDAMNQALLFTGAEGYGQGALQAPDKAVMQRLFPNPTEILKSPDIVRKGGRAGLKAALDAGIKHLEDRLYQVYGLKMGAQDPLKKGTTVPAPGAQAGSDGWTVINGIKVREKK